MTEEKLRVLVSDWSRTLQAVGEMEQTLAETKTRLVARADALARYVLPSDWPRAESFHIVVGERILTARIEGDGYLVEWKDKK